MPQADRSANEFVASTARDRRRDSQLGSGQAGFHTGVILDAAFWPWAGASPLKRPGKFLRIRRFAPALNCVSHVIQFSRP